MTADRRRSIGRIAATAGILSFWTVVLGAGIAWLGYAGTSGEAYSPLNHWISELGQEGVSARAPLFNAALVVAGIAFLLFIVGMALTSRSRLRWAFGPIGAIAGLGGAFVGLYPMNHPTEHVIAASTFFNLGWIAVALASITFLRFHDERYPRWLAGVGAAAVVAFVAFLASLRLDEYSRARMAATGPIAGRPDVWIAPILEWSVLAGIMAWTLLAGMTWRRALKSGLPAVGGR